MARSAQTSWVDGKSYCYKLTQTGSSVRWVRDDGRSGTARIGGQEAFPRRSAARVHAATALERRPRACPIAAL